MGEVTDDFHLAYIAYFTATWLAVARLSGQEKPLSDTLDLEVLLQVVIDLQSSSEQSLLKTEFITEYSFKEPKKLFLFEEGGNNAISISDF